MQGIGMTTARSWWQPSMQGQGRAVNSMEDLDLAPTEEDHYFRQGVGFLLILAVLFVLSQLAGLAAIYVGDEFTTPSWSEHSVPPPRTY